MVSKLRKYTFFSNLTYDEGVALVDPESLGAVGVYEEVLLVVVEEGEGGFARHLLEQIETFEFGGLF